MQDECWLSKTGFSDVRMRWCIAACILVWACLAAGVAMAQPLGTRIEFDSPARGKKERVWGFLSIPSTPQARYPLMLIMHSSGGIHARDWFFARKLNDIGVATFVLDSFGPRPRCRRDLVALGNAGKRLIGLPLGSFPRQTAVRSLWRAEQLRYGDPLGALAIHQDAHRAETVTPTTICHRISAALPTWRRWSRRVVTPTSGCIQKRSIRSTAVRSRYGTRARKFTPTAPTTGLPPTTPFG